MRRACPIIGVLLIAAAAVTVAVTLGRGKAEAPTPPIAPPPPKADAPPSTPPDETAEGKRGTEDAEPSQRDMEEGNRIALRAQAAQKAGKTDEAIALYRESVALSPIMLAAWNNLGLLLIEKKEYAAAVEALSRASELSPRDPRPEHNMGIACDRAGWNDKALDHYLRALERSPRDLKALRGAVASAGKLKRADDECLRRVRLALEIDDSAEWRPVYDREQARIEAALRDR